MVEVEGFEPTFDVISRTSYGSTVYKTASLHLVVTAPDSATGTLAWKARVLLLNYAVMF